MLLQADTIDTPCGPFSAAVNVEGAVVATAFGNIASLVERLPDGCHLISGTCAAMEMLKRQVSEYFSGLRKAFTIPLSAIGTDFQQNVWSALTAIPAGETRSYGQLADQLGKHGASRAVGRANATNPICLLVPCHRVIAADGSLGGFAFGEKIKRHLLELEGAPVPS